MRSFIQGSFRYLSLVMILWILKSVSFYCRDLEFMINMINTITPLRGRSARFNDDVLTPSKN